MFEGALNDSAAPPATDTSSVDQSSTPGLDNQNADVVNGGEETRGPIPYDRFAQVNTEKNDLSTQLAALRTELDRYKQWDPIVNELSTQYQTPDAVRAAQVQLEQTNFEQGLTNQLQRAIDAGEIDVDTAERHYDLAVRQRELDSALGRINSYEADRALNEARTKYPEADFDNVAHLARATGRPILEIAKQSHERTVSLIQQRIANYNANKQADGKTVPPEGSGGNVPGRKSVNDMTDAELKAYMDGELRRLGR